MEGEALFYNKTFSKRYPILGFSINIFLFSQIDERKPESLNLFRIMGLFGENASVKHIEPETRLQPLVKFFSSRFLRAVFTASVLN